MVLYAIRRLGWALVLCLVLSLVTFIIFYVIPTNSVRLRGGTVTDLAGWTGVQGPFIQQYVEWLWHVLHGSFGDSFFARRTVNEIVLDAAPITIFLTIGGTIFWLAISIPLGILSALHPRSLVDRGATIVVLVGLSAHPLWLGLIFSWFFGFKLGVLPKSNYCDLINPDTECGGPVQWFTHMLLPWFTFALVFAAMYVRMIRASIAETLHEDYVRAARAKGLSEWSAVRRHVLPNAMLPVVAMVAMDVGRFALPTALFVETAFGLPGLGRVLYDSLIRQDLPVLVGVVTFTAIAVVVVNLAADLLYAVFDPRVTLTSSRIRT